RSIFLQVRVQPIHRLTIRAVWMAWLFLSVLEVSVRSAETQKAPINPQVPILTNVAQVHGMSLAEAKRGYPVRLRALITYYEPKWDTLFIQDETGGTYVFPNDQPRPPYQAGQLID